MSHRRILIASFLNGFSAPVHILRRVPRPGSHAAEMDEATTPDMLAAYGKVDPSLPALLQSMKEQERKWDATYSNYVRIAGYVGLLSIIGAVCAIVIER
jgi:hypothetical protein